MYVNFSFFDESSRVFSSFILVQLMCYMISVSCAVFHIDLVSTLTEWIWKWFLDSTLIPPLLSANHKFWFHHVVVCHNISSRLLNAVSLLLLWCSCNGQLRTNSWCFIRSQLARFAHWIAEIFRDYDRESAATTLLPWIQCGHSEFTIVHQSEHSFENIQEKIIEILLHVDIVDRYFQFMRGVHTYYTMFKTLVQ